MKWYNPPCLHSEICPFISLDIQQGQYIFLCSISPRPAMRLNQLPIQLGTSGCYPAVKRAVREAQHSPPPTAEAKNSGAILLLPHNSSWRGA
jgi:hypothetical protein